MEHFNYKPTGVCSRNIEIELDGNRIEKVAFTGGCSGNTQGIAALIVGMDIDDAIARLSGIRCGLKQTSCPDQLARALLHIKSEREGKGSRIRRETAGNLRVVRYTMCDAESTRLLRRIVLQ